MDTLSLLILEYTEILIGNQKNYTDDYFSGSKAANKKLAIRFIRAVAHIYFQCDNLAAARITFNEQVFTAMKLDKIIRYIHVPSYVDKVDRTDYIINLIFTNNFDSELWVATRYCERVIAGTIPRFPKNYMLGDSDIQRSCFCLRYFLTYDFPSAPPAKLYAFAASTKFRPWLQNHLLTNSCSKLFSSPVEYLHLSLPENMRSEILFLIYDAVHALSTAPPHISPQYRNLVLPDDIPLPNQKGEP